MCWVAVASMTAAARCRLNNKMGGDLKKIQTVGRYMIEVWRAAGMNMENVEFIWASEAINRRAEFLASLHEPTAHLHHHPACAAAPRTSTGSA